ncbi:contractile injection system protein, VgrG/Pvc8 family [Pseudomonas folii]|uniref:Type IV secretion protein Rhs n=1 Tax=Pseudomonas folii TaxID=2762593 RepID=A0ABR7B369_9PSED|nr:contractile injection system protein, VgrG/Pvc8 family [Pseudomonas folii]MBC3951627.1 type IV secretion protein Rhs [Pseudomonas folii]
MSGPAVDHPFNLDIAPLFRRLQVLSFTGTEAISEPFVFELEVLIDEPYLDQQSLMYRAAFLSFQDDKTGVHGQIHSVTRSHFKPGPACYRLSIGPRLACLGQRYTPRVFQHMSTPQIISRVLLEHGLREDSYRFDLRAEYRKRDFCAQYRESDLQLVQRLCAEEGIHYHFHHSRKGHELVFGDGLRVFRRTSTANVQQVPMQAGVIRFAVTEGGEQSDRTRQKGEGESTLPFVSAGHLLPLMGHPQEDLNHLWLVTGVVHRGFDTRQLRSVPTVQKGMYINHFQVAPWESGFKPPPRPRACVATIQCAYVVGAVDEPVSADAEGRINVQFDWSYPGQGGEGGDCWLPVATHLSKTLRGGMPVVVSFIEGDMDRPLISACVWQSTDAIAESPKTSSPPEKLEVNLMPITAVDGRSWIQIEGGSRVSYQQGCELSFTVGDSTLSIDAAGVKLSSPQIQMTAGLKSDVDPER